MGTAEKFECPMCGRSSQAAKKRVECVFCGETVKVPWTHKACVARARRKFDHAHTVNEVMGREVPDEPEDPSPQQTLDGVHELATRRRRGNRGSK